MEPTREQLQAEILEILYQKCLQKPIWVSCAEIFWSISNLKVSERSVKDVLDWLVKNDLVIYQADKYQIAKREFMDISRRKALEKKETEENAEVRTVEYGTSIPPHTMNHHPWLEREYQQPVAKSSNTMFAIIALIAFLISGTLVGILLFNSFATERRNNAELTFPCGGAAYRCVSDRNVHYDGVFWLWLRVCRIDVVYDATDCSGKTPDVALCFCIRNHESGSHAPGNGQRLSE